MEGAFNSVKDEMKAVQEKMEAGQELVKQEMKLGQDEMETEIACMIENKFLPELEEISIHHQKGSSPRNAEPLSERPGSESCRNHPRVEEKTETTGSSPSQMFICRDLPLPCDFLMGRPADAAPSSPEEYIQDFQTRFEVTHGSARERVTWRRRR
ncbi:hypothetical protein X975_26228, partial [Stegodyphus mimosarum]